MGYKDDKAKYSKRSTIGSLITKASYTGSVWKPKWSKAGEVRLETHFRFTGPLTQDSKNFMSWRLGPEQNEFGDWLKSIPVFSGGTTDPQSFVAAFEDPDRKGKLLDTEVYPTPATVFLKHATKMAKSDPALKVMLLDKGSGKPAALPNKLVAVGLGQGILLRHGANDYYKKPQCPTILMMTPGCCWSLEDLLNKEVENYNGDPLDLKARFISGDLLDATTGKIISFFNAEAGVVAAAEEASVDWNKAGDSGSGRPQTKELPKYSCELRSKLGMPRDPAGRIVGIGGKPMFTPWEQVIRIMDAREQVEVLCRAYGDLPGLLQDCLRTYKEYWPNYLKGNATVTTAGAPAAPSAALKSAQTASDNPPAADPEENDAGVDWGNAGVAPDSDTESGGMTDSMVPDGIPGAVTPAAAAANAIEAEQAKIVAARAKLAAMRAGIQK